MKPIVPDSLFSAAAAPTRKEPCSSANVIEATFCSGTSSVTSSGVPIGSTATESMAPNSWSGLARAAACRSAPHRKPTPMTRSRSWPSMFSMRSARSPSLVGVDSVPVAPTDSLAASRPAAAESLNDLSPRPVTSYSRPTAGFSTAGAAVPSGAVPSAVVPSGVVPASAVSSGVVPSVSAVVPSAVVSADVAAVVASLDASEAALPPVSSSSSPPHAAATRPSAATSPTASRRLLLIIASPFSGIGVSQTGAGWFTPSRPDRPVTYRAVRANGVGADRIDAPGQPAAPGPPRVRAAIAAASCGQPARRTAAVARPRSSRA